MYHSEHFLLCWHCNFPQNGGGNTEFPRAHCNVCQQETLDVISPKYRKGVAVVIDAALCKKCCEVPVPSLSSSSRLEGGRGYPLPLFSVDIFVCQLPISSAVDTPYSPSCPVNPIPQAEIMRQCYLYNLGWLESLRSLHLNSCVLSPMEIFNSSTNSLVTQISGWKRGCCFIVYQNGI